MIETVYDIGDRVRLDTTVTNLTGTPTNATVTLTVMTPGGDNITPTVINDAAGVYRADVDVDRPGMWFYRWRATGMVVAAQNGHFYVRRLLA